VPDVPPGEEAAPQPGDAGRGDGGPGRGPGRAPAAARRWGSPGHGRRTPALPGPDGLGGAGAVQEGGTDYFSRLSQASQSTFLRNASTYFARSKAL
jgi:hypothetical protein